MAGRIILGIANPALDANGKPDSGSTLTFYENGTTTPQSIFTDPTLLTPLPNPLSCDAAGRFPIVWGDNESIYSVKWTLTGGSNITFDDIAVGLEQDAGSWTPVDASGAGLAITVANATYIRVGNLVFASFRLVYPATGASSPAHIGGLPFPVANQPDLPVNVIIGSGVSVVALGDRGASTFAFNPTNSLSVVQVSVLSAATLIGCIVYPVA